MNARGTQYEQRLRGRLLNIARKLGMPAVDCRIIKQWFAADECGGPWSLIIVAVYPDKDTLVEGYGNTRIAAVADALRRLAEHHHPGGDRFERIVGTGEAVSPTVAALMPLFGTKGNVNHVALCTSPEPYIRELGFRLSAIASPIPGEHRLTPPQSTTRHA